MLIAIFVFFFFLERLWFLFLRSRTLLNVNCPSFFHYIPLPFSLISFLSSLKISLPFSFSLLFEWFLHSFFNLLHFSFTYFFLFLNDIPNFFLPLVFRFERFFYYYPLIHCSFLFFLIYCCFHFLEWYYSLNFFFFSWLPPIFCLHFSFISSFMSFPYHVLFFFLLKILTLRKY